MPRHIPDAAYDAYFDYFEACTRLHLVSGAETPTDLEGSLAVATIDGGDFSVGAGTPDGRRLTVAAQNAIDVTAVGTTTHAVLAHLDDVGPPEVWGIRLVTECSERSVDDTAGDKVNMGEFYLQVAAPVAP